MGKLNFCRQTVYLNQAPISFARRPYLPAIYGVQDRNLVIRASRQVEKSTLLVNTILFEAYIRPGSSILFVSPRQDQTRVFSHDRLRKTIDESPLLRRALLGRGSQTKMADFRFSNGTRVSLRSAYLSADSCRGMSATLLLADEFQDIAPGVLPVLQETLSHAPGGGRTILTGTPKMIDNHLEAMFNQSTANQWTIACSGCQKQVILDERCLGATGIVCPGCQGPLDVSQGRWVPRNPGARWGEGFWISHPMVPWLDFDDICERRSSYDPVRFLNEVLGLPTTLGDHIVTIEELEACCASWPMAKSTSGVPAASRQRLVAGIDWGGGVSSRTVVVIGAMNDKFEFEIYFMDAIPAREDPQRVIAEVARHCQRFGVMCLASDGGGNGHVYNRLLAAEVQPRYGNYALLYSATDHDPIRDGVLTKWTVGRSPSIGVLFGRVKQHKLKFPHLPDVQRFLPEFACETAVYDDQTRTIKYTHPETQPDDALHATNYALLVATRAYHAARQYG